jgi:hypothetical protein
MGGKQMTEEKKKISDFVNSMRGTYIISQALYYTIRELESVPEGRRELSNIKDMEYLREHVFNIFPIAGEVEPSLHDKEKVINE